MSVANYPVDYQIVRPESYNRRTVGFRFILVIPHAILVGGAIGLSNNGLLVAVLTALVFFAWWAILFTGRFPAGMQSFGLFIFRWQQNVHAYIALQAAPYPPFGAGDYPLRLEITPTQQHDRVTVAFRLILVIPHVVVLIFLGLAQAIVTVIAWFAILITGQFPPGMFAFSVGVSRWAARVLAYLYLFVDEYPPFALESSAANAAPGPAPV